MAGLRDVVFTGIFLFFLTQRISSNSSKSMSVWLFYLFHFHTFEDKINTCSRSGHRIITCCRYIQDNYRRLIYRVPSSAFSLRSFLCGVTAASGEESRKLLIWQHCAASPAESWEVISHNFNKQYKQKNEQHIMIISWVTEIHAEKFSLPCNITKWVLRLYNLSAPLSYVAQVPSASVSVDADWDDGSFWKLRSPSLKSHWCCCAFIAWNSCYWIPPTTIGILRSRFRVFVYL